MLQVVCFSRRRPLQLHGYLTSLFDNCWGDLTVSVLVRLDEPYSAAYQAVQDEFPQVELCSETDFAGDLTSLLGDADLTMFGCDDVVYVAPFRVSDVVSWLADSSLGVSLRLGLNISRDMFGNPLPRPEMPDEFPWWRVDGNSQGDWAYPWEVLGTVYRTEFVKEMVADIHPGSPSQLEERGSRCWPAHTDLRHMFAYSTSRLVVPTVNLVQQEFPNGIAGNASLSPEFLLECWNQGLRMDTGRYSGMAPESWRIPDFYLRRAA